MVRIVGAVGCTTPQISDGRAFSDVVVVVVMVMVLHWKGHQLVVW